MIIKIYFGDSNGDLPNAKAYIVQPRLHISHQPPISHEFGTYKLKNKNQKDIQNNNNMKYNDIEDDNITDDDENEFSSDEFGIKQQYDDQSLVTGRMRKKNVARSKGGEFLNRRQ